MQKRNATLLLLAVGCLLLAPATASAVIPSDKLVASLKAGGYVNDYAGVLSAGEKQALEQRCVDLKTKTGAELAVVVLQSLEGGQIDDFTNKLFASWRVGDKEKDNGILLLVALQDRKARIEVGYGLEPILPDALAGRILDEGLFPEFRNQRYGAGLQSTVDRIAGIVERNEPAPQNLVPKDARPFFGALCMLSFLIPFTCIIAYKIGVGLRSMHSGTALGPFLILIFVLVLFVAIDRLWWTLALILPADLAAVCLGWWRGTDISPPNWRRGGSPWIGGPFTRGWSSGGSSGGGGFSGGGFGGFGGGRSGGGGASGSW